MTETNPSPQKQGEQEWLNSILNEFANTAIKLAPDDYAAAYSSVQKAKAAINQRFDEAVGEDEYPSDDIPNVNYKRTPRNRYRDDLRRQQRQAWYTPTLSKEEVTHEEKK